MIPDAKRRPVRGAVANNQTNRPKTSTTGPAQDAAAAEAELVAAAVAVERIGYLNVRRVAGPGDFHDPRCARVIRWAGDPAVDLAETLAPAGEKLAERIRVIAKRADVDRAWLEGLAHDRPVMVDAAGSYARRVRLDSLRRQQWEASEELTAAARAGDHLKVRRLAALIDRLAAEAAQLGKGTAGAGSSDDVAA